MTQYKLYTPEQIAKMAIPAHPLLWHAVTEAIRHAVKPYEEQIEHLQKTMTAEGIEAFKRKYESKSSEDVAKETEAE